MNSSLICLNNVNYSTQPTVRVRGSGTTKAESCYSSFAMNNRTTCWGLSRLPSPTSFSGLWKCFTIPLMASPTPSWIWPVFNSGGEAKSKQRCCETIQADTGKENPCPGFIWLSLCFLIHVFEFLAVSVLKTGLCFHIKNVQTLPLSMTSGSTVE